MLEYYAQSNSILYYYLLQMIKMTLNFQKVANTTNNFKKCGKYCLFLVHSLFPTIILLLFVWEAT